MKKIYNKGFTLAELLATIAVLAIILVIAVPQIQKLIYNSRLKSFETTARIIARKAEDEAMDSRMLKENKSLACKDLVEMSDDYGTCTVRIENNEAVVKLNGNTTGKFVGMTCKGTKRDMECGKASETVNPADNENPSEYLIDLLDKETTTTGCDGTGKLIEVRHENGDVDYRYVGACPNNYVTFNNETWRIIGIFDTQKTLNGSKERRVKLIRNDSLGNYVWDSSESGINQGYGINQWGKSSYENGNLYEGADLMLELNGDYLNSSLSSNTTWYNGSSNTKTATFDKSKVLKLSAQELIDDALWYLGGSEQNASLSTQYANERGNITCQAENITGCVYLGGNDKVLRMNTWIGKVGLIYPSDYGYASENPTCKENLGGTNPYPCKNDNWLSPNYYYWTITPSYSTADNVLNISYYGYVYDKSDARNQYRTCPSVYLKSNVLMSGEGTKDNPYTFTLKNN